MVMAFVLDDMELLGNVKDGRDPACFSFLFLMKLESDCFYTSEQGERHRCHVF